VTLRGSAIATFAAFGAILLGGSLWLNEGSHGIGDRIALVSGSALVVAAIALGLFLRVVLGQLRSLGAQMQTIGSSPAGYLAEKNSSAVADATGEIGQLGHSLAQMLAALAAHDAELQATQELRERRLRDDFGQQRRAAEEIRVRAQKVVDETVQAVLNDLELVIDQVNDVRAAAGTIDEGVSAASEVTRRVVARAHEADLVVSDLGKSLHKVDDMARVIAQVAGQTNLLALNATIEAVRAGTAGAGFAVVATEVKGLARTTADSTGDITETISMLERDAAAVGDALSGMSNGVADIDAATAELSAVALRQHAIVDMLAQRIMETKTRISDIASASRKLERRASDRIPVELDAQMLVAGQQITVSLTSMSDTGLSGRTRTPITVPVNIVLSMQLAGRPVEITARAVRHIDGDTSHIGVAFDADDPNPLVAIREYLDGVETVRAG
jgi:methyl-accepting chemotaxis protein